MVLIRFVFLYRIYRKRVTKNPLYKRIHQRLTRLGYNSSCRIGPCYSYIFSTWRETFGILFSLFLDETSPPVEHSTETIHQTDVGYMYTSTPSNLYGKAFVPAGSPPSPNLLSHERKFNNYRSSSIPWVNVTPALLRAHFYRCCRCCCCRLGNERFLIPSW